MPLATSSLLRSLGWEEVEHPFRDAACFRVCFGPFELQAAAGMTRWFQRTFLITGIINTGRKIAFVEREMPLDVENEAEGLAWLGDILGTSIPDTLKPDWLLRGEAQRHLLPWVAEQAAYDARPQCSIERDWMRIACRKLREHALGAVEYDTSTFYFDGEVLDIRAHAAESIPRVFRMAMPAKGDAWTELASVSTWRLETLPRRLMTASVEVSVWEGKLTIGNGRLELMAPPKTEAPSASPVAPASVSIEGLSFFEMEGSCVAKGRASDGRAFAFVFDGETWLPAPGKLRNSGSILSQTDLANEFRAAYADMASLKAMAKDVPETAFSDPDEMVELSFFEIEGRPVAKGLSDGRAFAFVFNEDSAWVPARGLVKKRWFQAVPNLFHERVFRSGPVHCRAELAGEGAARNRVPSG